MAVTPAWLDEGLWRLARIAVGVGAALQPGQPLAITAPVAARDIVHRLAVTAYRLGGGLVTCAYEDPDLIRLALTDMDHLPADAMGHHAWEAPSSSSPPAGLRLVGPEPNLLNGIPLERILALHKIMHAHEEDTLRHDASNCTMPFVTRDWATAVRPGVPAEKAVEMLWRDIFRLCGADSDGAESRFVEALEHKERICRWLTELKLRSLHLFGRGTNLRISLLEDAPWSFARRATRAGIRYLADFPAGPMQALLDPGATEGVLKIAQPIRIAGVCVQNLALRFEAGRVSSCDGPSGRDAFERLLATDAGAARLGRIGLPDGSTDATLPLREFLAPILDKAVRPHVTFGPVEPAGTAAHAEANQSVLSVDVFLEQSGLEVHGVRSDGSKEQVYSNGRFLF